MSHDAAPSPPVFLLGAARSGTSLLYKCLCLHPEAAWVSNWVRRFPDLPALGALNRLPARLSRARTAVWFGGGGNAYVYGTPRRWAERVFPMPVEGEPFFNRHGIAAPGGDPCPRPSTTLPAAVAAVTRASGGRVFVSKRIANNWRVPQLVAAFPSARFVELVRDGRAVAYSLSRVDWWEDSELVWLPGTPADWHRRGMDPWELCARNWVAELDAIADGLGAVPADRRLRLAYEDFVTAPIETLERVAAFAGLGPGAEWRNRLAELSFPDRNEAWRARLEPAVARRIEAFQHAHLEANGYAVG
jgi:Sulfotransferase family